MLNSSANPEGVISFDLSLDVKLEGYEPPVLTGAFAHGPPRGRFLYLSWREPRGRFAKRLKLPLNSISWEQVRLARATGKPVECVLIDKNPKATSTGANIGGARQVVWKIDVHPRSEGVSA